jgi:proton-dependent oligopeptide transporter, POT family
MHGKTFFGHPGLLRVLFFTELWERFSYYGMRAILVLFMVASPARGGLGIEDKNAAAIYGLYTMCVYMVALPGGWLADNLLGLRQAVFLGGCLIATGHLIMAFPNELSFFTGLIFIVLGTGLLKPNISCMVGGLYHNHEHSKRDAAFSIFFVGINIGAFIAPLIVGYFGERINWHLGFAASGIGMLIGLIYFKMNWKLLDKPRFGVPGNDERFQKKIKNILLLFLIMLVAVFALISTKVVPFNPSIVAQSSSFVLILFVIIYFAFILLGKQIEVQEKKNVYLIIILFLFSIVFYMGYEQAGSSINLFADRYTDRIIGAFEVPASWFQSLPSFYVFMFAPLFAWLWIWLAKRGKRISIPLKIGAGLFFIGLAFLPLTIASYIYAGGEKPSYMWLVLTFGLHTVAEVCLYPVALSSVTMLAPKNLTGQMMGVFFMSLAMGNLLAGIFAGNFKATSINANPMVQVFLFGILAAILFSSCIILVFFRRPFSEVKLDEVTVAH